MSYDRHYDRDIDAGQLGRPAPTLIWGLVMTAALGGAGLAMWRAQAGGPETRLVASIDGQAVDRLDRDVKRIAAEREELAARLARLERGVGELKIAALQGASETTGSIDRPAPAASSPGRPPAFAIALGPETSVEAARRRWSALAGRYPKTLSALAARTVRSGANGKAFALLAGPFATADAAARACAELAADGVPCDTTAYAGEPLDRS